MKTSAPSTPSVEPAPNQAEMLSATQKSHLAALPGVDTLVSRVQTASLIQAYGRGLVTRACRQAIAQARQKILSRPMDTKDQDDDELVPTAALLSACQSLLASTLRPAINATGIIVHTNLGRAPLAAEALQAITDVAQGYASLEYDLDAGGRSSRHDHCVSLLTELTGAQAAAVVNNNAGAVLIALSALAHQREVVVSRGELVEIGGGFRIPDVMESSGCHLVEVGTTNRTWPRDYSAVLSEQTALLLQVHQSNFAQVGFTHAVTSSELSQIAQPSGIPLMVDAGSGCLLPEPHAPNEPTVAQLISSGVDLVTFSGDKLLGGPQAGLIVGRADLVEKIRSHPLMRALRPDKICLASLLATLRLWRDCPEAIPTRRMLSTSVASLKERAVRLQEQIAHPHVSTESMVSRIGGGTSPLVEVESFGMCVRRSGLSRLHQKLRHHEPAVVTRIDDDALWIDLRTVAPNQDTLLKDALVTTLEST